MTDEFFYKSKNAALICGDSFDWLDRLKAEKKQFEMIFADPPYFLSNGGMSVHSGKRIKVDKGKWDKSKGLDDDYNFTFKWLKKCKDLITENGTIWISGTLHNIYIVGYLLQKQGFTVLNDIAWYKPNAAPHLACRYFAHSHETLLWAKKSKKAKHNFNYELMKQFYDDKDIIKKENKQMRSVWYIPTPKKEEKKFGSHPTQKPEALLNRIILSCTDKGDNILDPFCGSGTAGVAACRCARKFVGIDKDASFLEIAQKRIQAI